MRFKNWPELNWFGELVGSGRRFPFSLMDALDIPYQLRRVKWFFQRGWRGWADSDVWNAGHYLAEVGAGVTRRLSKTFVGVPWTFVGVPCKMGEDGKALLSEDGSEPIFHTEETWRAMLEKIAEGFEAFPHTTLDCDCKNWNDGIHDTYYRERFEGGMEMLKLCMRAMWD